MSFVRSINKKIFKCISLILFFVCVGSFSLHVSASSSNIQNAKNGVVCVATTDKSSQIIGWGTGFAIGKPNQAVQYIVTNYHVIENALSNNLTINVFYSQQSDKYVSASVIVGSPDKDIAVLKLSQPLGEIQSLSLMESNKVYDSQNVFALGYPGDALTGSVTKNFNRTDITITSGIISNRLVQLGEKCFQTDVSISPGDSGGPLLNQNGDVVGINTRSLKDNSSINYAIVSDELITILKQNNIACDIKGNSNATTIIIIGSAILFLIVITVLVILRKKNKNSSFEEIAEVIQTAPNLNRIITTQDDKSVSIYGLTGKYAGSKFGVRSGRLIFGCNSIGCDIIFPTEDDIISEKHCEITYDKNISAYTIRDLNSQGGTFLSNAKLAPHIPTQIYDGDVFYLTSKKNMFKIRIE